MNDQIQPRCVKTVLHYTVARELGEAARLQVESRFPLMERNVDYTLEDICGEEFWDQLSKVERRQVGHHVANLVRAGELPLVFGERRSDNAKTYRLN